MARVRIALVGDHDASVTAHRAIPLALARARDTLGCDTEWLWVGTETIGAPDGAPLTGFDAFWCVPASPYRSTAGALEAIRFARESGRPFLGTCGGFQHAVLEFARHVAGLAEADHAETNPEAHAAVITPLACSLVEKQDEIALVDGSRLHRIYGRSPIVEEYRCRYGLDPRYEARLVSAGLAVAGRDANGDVRAVELPGHSFFVATLFQPERAALRGRDSPLVQAFLAAAADARSASSPGR